MNTYLNPRGRLTLGPEEGQGAIGCVSGETEGSASSNARDLLFGRLTDVLLVDDCGSSNSASPREPRASRGVYDLLKCLSMANAVASSPWHSLPTATSSFSAAVLRVLFCCSTSCTFRRTPWREVRPSGTSYWHARCCAAQAAQDGRLPSHCQGDEGVSLTHSSSVWNC